MMKDHISVLIVDDHRKTRKGLMALLAFAENIRIVGEASNGAEALVYIQKVSPDVVLMDLQMPVIDGIQAIQLIKNNWPWVRVIAMTVFPEYREAAVAAGTDYFLLKGDPNESIQDIINLVAEEQYLDGDRFTL